MCCCHHCRFVLTTFSIVLCDSSTFFFLRLSIFLVFSRLMLFVCLTGLSNDGNDNDDDSCLSAVKMFSMKDDDNSDIDSFVGERTRELLLRKRIQQIKIFSYLHELSTLNSLFVGTRKYPKLK